MAEKFQKRPKEIEAIQFIDDAERITEIQKFAGDTIKVDYADKENPKLKIETLEGTMEASVGDWIIKGLKGELYPCKPDIFVESYSKVPKDFIERIELELKELREDADKLANFIGSDKYQGIGAIQQYLLDQQYGFMIGHIRMLDLRLADLKK